MSDTTESTHQRGGLNYHVFTNSTAGLASNAVLLAGERDAVLVDTSLTLSDGAELVQRVKATGRNLSKILITHAHPDHYGSLPLFKKEFPDVEILARQPIIDGMIEWPAKQLHWKDQYGDDIPQYTVLPQPLLGDHVEIEGRQLAIIDLPPAETVHATAFWMPEHKTFIAGDLLYERSHLYMADTNDPEAWISAIDTVRNLGAFATVIPGHGRTGTDEIFGLTEGWLTTYREIAQPHLRFNEIAQQMYERYPDYALAIVLWLTRGPAFGLDGPAAAGIPPEVLGVPREPAMEG